MKRTILIAVLAGLTGGPVLAEECNYQSRHDWGSVSFPSDSRAILNEGSGYEVTCNLLWGDESANVMMCDDGTKYGFGFFPASAESNDFTELLVFLDTVWYKTCS